MEGLAAGTRLVIIGTKHTADGGYFASRGGGMCSDYTEGFSRSSAKTQPRAIDRMAFLKLSGAGLAGVALLGSLDSATALAQTRAEAQPKSSLMAEFREAAEEHGVPQELLMAMGWVNTRWEMPPPEANEYEEGSLHGWGSYGIMALVQNPFSDTLGEASRLTGFPEEELKTDRAANIRGGAALLGSAVGTQKSSRLAGFFGAVAGRGRAAGHNYRAVAGIGGGELYAEQVFDALRRGVPEEKLKSGERLSLKAQSLSDRIGAP
jgi:hypothetical protein